MVCRGGGLMLWSDTEIEFMRECQLSLMGDTVLVERATGTRWDQDAQRTVTVWVKVYEGAGRVAAQPLTPALAGDGSVRGEQPVMLTVPHTVTLAKGDRVTVQGNNPAVLWVGRVEISALPATSTRAECSTVKGTP